MVVIPVKETLFLVPVYGEIGGIKIEHEMFWWLAMGGDKLINQNFRIKPRPGMLLAFPSDHRYLHAALPTVSGIRYVIVSWAAVLGSKRVRTQMPYGSVFIRQKRVA